MRRRDPLPAGRRPVPEQLRDAAHAPRLRGLAGAFAQAPSPAPLALRSGEPPEGLARGKLSPGDRTRPRCEAARAARRHRKGVVRFLALLFSAPALAWPRPWPTKPIRMVVNFPPGGVNDVT